MPVYAFHLVVCSATVRLISGRKAAALLVNICSCILARTKIALIPPGPPLSAETAIALIKAAGTNVAVLPPSTLDDIGKQAHLLKYLGNMKAVLAAGGSVSQAAGDAIITKTRLINILGMTEVGTLAQLEVDPEDWAYIRPSSLSGAEFRHFAGDSYELHIVREEKLTGYQTTFELFPNLKEFSTHDLFCKHPTKSNHWLYNGRSDDVIVFLNGEKTNPVSFEGLLQSRPDVRAALVTGQGRFEAALLIETTHSSEMSSSQKADFIERIWPTVEKANRRCPAHARISKSHILFTTPEKPMCRAGKGTVQRRFTIDNYSAELHKLYADVDSLEENGIPINVNLHDLEGSIKQILAYTAGYEGISSDTDIFSLGMDSIQVIQTARYLKAGLETAGMKAGELAPSVIYTNPTVTKLVYAIETLRQGSRKCEESKEKTHMDVMQAMMTKFSSFHSHDDQAGQHQNDTRTRRPRTVILTGSTGALGSYLLEAVLNIDSISKIYCLNRAPKSKQRQAKVNVSRGLRTHWDDESVSFLTSDFTRDDLGLGHDAYQEIVAGADLILHNAWQVDFNLSLPSYEDHIHGVHNLVNLCRRSAHHATTFFISSIGAVANWSAHHNGQVPEQIFSDFTVPSAMGYAESKHVAERLLDTAQTDLNIPVSICRVGQIAGPVAGSKGMWNKHEWLPSLLLSSQYLDMIPESLGTLSDIDWIPIDLLSTIIVELALNSAAARRTKTAVFHTVNPNITHWRDLLPSIQTEIGPEVEVVSLQTWLEALRASARSATTEQDLNANPAVKLMDFYGSLLEDAKGLPKMETTGTEAASPRLRRVGPVRSEWMVKWIRQWKETEDDQYLSQD